MIATLPPSGMLSIMYWAARAPASRLSEAMTDVSLAPAASAAAGSTRSSTLMIGIPAWFAATRAGINVAGVIGETMD